MSVLRLGKRLIFFCGQKCNFRYAWPCFQIYGNRVYQSAVIVLILICVHTYSRAKLTSKSSDIIIHFVGPKLKGIGHFVRRLCKKYFKACSLDKYGVRQSKITKGTVLAGLGGEMLRRRDGQIGPVHPFPPRGSPLTSNIVWR